MVAKVMQTSIRPAGTDPRVRPRLPQASSILLPIAALRER